MPRFVSLVGLTVIASCLLRAEQRAPVQSQLLKVNERGAITVIVNAGSDNGVKIFDVCDVYRDQQRIGSLRITSVEKSQSGADITAVHPNKKLKPGDRVVVDMTLQFLRNLRPDPAIEKPVELGRKYANADIGGDLKRVLYFGKPWSQGKPLIDDESDYPITITAGCTISREFVDFVDGYNAAVRSHFETHETADK